MKKLLLMASLTAVIGVVLLTGCAGMPAEMENYLIDLGKQAGHVTVNTAVSDIVHAKTAPTEECKIYVKGKSIRSKCKLD